MRGKPFDLKRHLPSTAFVALLVVIISAGAAVFIYSGVYDIGADVPHYKPVYRAVDQLREKAIASHARNIAAPADLNDPRRIAIGAGLYGGMCATCHGAPGEEKSDLAKGLYPPAPELARDQKHTAPQQFWIIKHGVKLSAMPAWGKTHDDQLIWDMVAFLRTLPKLSPEQYKAAVASAPSDEEAMGEAMPGMMKSDEAGSERAGGKRE